MIVRHAHQWQTAVTRQIDDVSHNRRCRCIATGTRPHQQYLADKIAIDVDSIQRAAHCGNGACGRHKAWFHRLFNPACGFARDSSSEVICRWVHKASGVLFDLMPVQPEVLGFSNRWYPYAVESAVRVDLGSGMAIRVVSAVAFVATKLEAFASRGGGDFMSSHDLEDVLNIVDGREELVDEMATAPLELKRAVATAFVQLRKHPDFANVLPGLIAEPERAGLVMERLRALSG